VYDLVEGRFVAIQSFFERVEVNLETDLPESFDAIVVKVLVSILKICGIATEYARDNKIKRSASIPYPPLT